MEKKTFSVKDGTLVIVGSGLFLLNNDGDTEPIATTYEPIDKDNVYQLPPTLIRKTKTDEELAEEYYPKEWSKKYHSAIQVAFIDGLKARGGEFHLTTEQLENVIDNARKFTVCKDSDGFSTQPRWKYRKDDIISSLTPPIYPTKITVDYDGENYYWGTLKAEY